MQKDIFLAGEGDEWVGRNSDYLSNLDWGKSDPLFQELVSLGLPANLRVLEIGCGEGSRLEALSKALGWTCSGLDPSFKGIEIARIKGVDAKQGTADILPWEDGFFDVVLFGFCLYLCDRKDLFQIATEANRVLKNPGWMGIIDFFARENKQKDYSHKAGVKSFKMDYRKLFEWHPGYECYSHRLMDHEGHKVTDVEDNWISVSMLRKNIIS